MATRLLEHKTKMTDKGVTLLALPSIPSGRLYVGASLIKDAPGYLTGYTIEATSTEGDLTVEIWDMDWAMAVVDGFIPNAVTRVCVARLTLRTTTTGDMASWSTPNECGVECIHGIYMYATGDGQGEERGYIFVYYK